MSHNDVVVANILSDAQQHYIRDGSSSVVIELLKQAMVLVGHQSNSGHSIKSNLLVVQKSGFKTFIDNPTIGASLDPYVVHNLASGLAVSGKYSAALDVIDRIVEISSMSINFDLVGVRLMNTFLRIEIVLKLSEKKEYSEECSKIIVHQIQRGMDEVQYLSKTYFHAEHIPFVPKGADVRYLSPPTQPAGCTETDQWKYSSCDLSTITSNDEQTHITPYGYLLLVGLVVEFRSLLYCARHAITCRRYGAARDKLRSAFALYAKHLKQVETAPDMTELNTNLNVSADIPSLPKWGVSSLSSLVGKCGDISPTSPESMTFQLKRQFDIAMQVLAHLYFRTRVFPDALSTLCGCPSVPLYDALRPIHTGMRDACISNNLGCVLLQAGKPHCALLLLQRSCSPALPSSPTSAESEEADTRAVACSEDFHGSLRHRDTAAAYYNEALVLLKLQQPLPALALLQAISKQEDPLAQRPHLHIRKAECIMLHHHLLRSAMASKPIEVQQVGSGLSEKFLLRFSGSCTALDATQLLDYTRSAIHGRGAISTPPYIAGCVQSILQSLGQIDTKQQNQLDLHAQLVVQQLREAASLSKAVDCLSKALGIINKALVKATAAGGSVMETNLLGMKSSVLLKLTYLQLQLDNPHSAVRSADELLLMPSLPSTESNKHLVLSYNVEILCRLGREHEAAVALKSTTAATMCAWQQTLLGVSETDTMGRDGASLVDAPTVADAVLLSPTLFFSGSARIAELRTSPSAYEVLVKQLLRVDDAVVLMLRCEMEAARVILEDVVRCDKDLVPAVQNLVYVYIKQGKVTDALGLIKVLHCMPFYG